MTLQEYCNYLGWSGRELAHQAHINPRTARKALAQKSVAGHVATKIATALSAALDRKINVGDVENLTTRR